MKSSNCRLLALIFSLSFCFVANAQKKGVSKAYIHKKNQVIKVDGLVKSADFFRQKSTDLGLGSHDKMLLKKESAGKNNYTYQKYEQHYKGVPVFGSAYTLRIKDGHVKGASGYYLPMIELDIAPSISTKQAISMAMDSMGAETYVWQDPAMIKISTYAQKPEAKLVIVDAAYPSSSEKYVLAYQVDLQSTQPRDKKRFFIDAHSGKMILDLPLMMQHAVPGKGQTKYYGEQSFTVDSIGPNNYILRDLSRGDGNTVFNSNGQMFSDEDNYWDLGNENQDEVAVDAHYCTEKFYDLMLNRFDWDGLDGEGRSMNSIIHIGQIINAFWDGSSASFGDGGCHHGPLTTLEVVAHEFMHGITEFSSGLIYQDESGAINESLSDVFGKALEYYEDPENFDWTIGHSFIETQYAIPFRSFVEPNEFGHPNFYKGEFWSSFGAVHTNSSVGNHWFYLLVNGGQGVNEAGVSYSVQGIGMDKALEIVFHAETLSLIPNSDYAFYLEVSKLAAEELFGEDSDELKNTEEAWKAVGVGESTTQLDLSIGSLAISIDTCQAQSYIPIEITLSNVSDVPYSPEMNGIVELFIGTFTQFETFDLVDAILPGETVTYTLDGLWFVGDIESSFVQMEIFVDVDRTTANNRQFIFLDNRLYENDDLRLDQGFFTLSNIPTCFGGETRISLLAVNNSCNDIPAGTPFELHIYNENEELQWSQAYTLPFSLATNDGYFFNAFFALQDFEASLLNFVLVYDDETNVDNNSFLTSMPTGGVFESTFEESFDGGPLSKIEVNGNNVVFDWPVDYQSETYFGATGVFVQSELNICPNPEDVFLNFNQISMEFCLDTKDIENPNLEFDLVQFRKDLGQEFAGLTENSNVVKVSWTDGQNDFEEFIVGQSEGDQMHHSYQLPTGQQGVVSITLFINSGIAAFEDLFQNDVTLLDNLAVTEVVTSVKETELVEFTASPNPTSGIVTLTYEDIPEQIVVKNIHNVEVYRMRPNQNRTEVDINHLPSGVYIFSLLYSDRFGSSLVTKVK